MKKRNILIILILAVTILSVSFFSYFSGSYPDTNTNELKVTLEHPFFIDNKWIPASQLQVGDLLTTLDGKKARITKITDVVSDKPFLVYNFEDKLYNNYIANDIIVHNSNIPRPNFLGIAEISPSELKTFYESKTVIDRLATERAPGVKWAVGIYKDVYIIDPKEVDLRALPEDIRKIVAASDKPVVFKYLVPEPRNTVSEDLDLRAESFLDEIEAAKKINQRLESTGVRKLFSEQAYTFGMSFDSNNKPVLRGLIIEPEITEESASSVISKLNENVFFMVPTNDRLILLKQRSKDLREKVNKQIMLSDGELRRVLKQEGITWYDTHKGNFAFGFSEKATGKQLTLEQVLNGNYNIGNTARDGDIEVYLKAYEAGLARIVEPGRGFLEDLNDLML